MKRAAAACAVLLAATAAAPAPRSLDDLSWMTGHWLECTPRGEAMETWSDARGGVMLGFSKSIRGTRTDWELARIEPRPEGIVFATSPKGQPAATFAAVSITTGEALFEARDHDFPQRVIYRRDGDRLTGRIEGTIAGKPRAVEWHYRRAPLGEACPAAASQ
ncbi:MULTISPECIES: DUF6265 family protein [Sphingomonas]|uniref:DUF6265 family protein n=1 Tax=Sphingomonas TaxID=13687 RepID=UPI0008354FFA|nr:MULTISPECIES: DUF6265 family protein [Sphingomonas]MBY0300662.1 hypothetical protein [Sphingomonas ginsenosidimutans]